MVPVSFSIIIPCRNEGVNLKQTLDNMVPLMPRGRDWEIIVVDDGSDDGCADFLRSGFLPGVRLVTSQHLGAARARNLGAQEATGDLLVFCDAHLLVEEGWLENLSLCLDDEGADCIVPGIAPFDNPYNVGFGQTWGRSLQVQWLVHSPTRPGEIPLAPGACMVVRSDVFHRVGGFDSFFKIWGHEDVELSLKLWLFGYRLMVDPRVRVLHLFRQSHPYRVTMDHVHHNLLRMAFSHFSQPRLAKAVNLARSNPNLGRIITEVLFSDIWQQREHYLANRMRDDQWFMDRFNIPF